MTENTKKLTGYSSIDKPWLMHYDERANLNIDINKSAFDFIYDINRDYPKDIAVNYYGHEITMEEFFVNCIRFGKSLSYLGAKHNSVITILLPTMPYTYYALYGINYIGSIANPIDIRSSIENVKHYINECKSEILLIHENMGSNKYYQDILEETTIKHIVVIPSPIESLPFVKRQFANMYLEIKDKIIKYDNKHIIEWEAFNSFSENIDFDKSSVSNDFDKVSVLMHTSGTTGKMPKTVMANNKNINCMAAQYMKGLMDLKRGQISLDIMPKWIFYGYLGVHMPLAFGMTVVPIADPSNEPFDDLIINFKPQNVAGIPNHAIQLLNNPKIKDIKCITTLGIGGDTIPLECEKKLNQLLQEKGKIKYCSPGYGASENTSTGTANQSEVYKVGSVGIPFPDINIMIIDAKLYNEKKELQELTYNEDGIICLSGNLMLGYYDDTNGDYEEVIYKDKKGEKWYVSGDIGYIDQDGFLFFKNREKDLIVGTDGFKIVPKVIESIVETHSDVARCVVIGKKCDGNVVGDYPCCYIELKISATTKMKRTKIKKEIISLLKRNVSSYYMPHEYFFVKKIPLTNMGKVDRKKLSRMGLKYFLQ